LAIKIEEVLKLRIGFSIDLISNERWNIMKSMGKLKFTFEVAIGLAVAFVILSLIINIAEIFLGQGVLPYYQYVLIILVIPSLLGILDAYTQIYFEWKFNYFVYEAREQNMSKYKKYYYVGSLIQFLIILIVIKVFYDGKSLFNITLFDYVVEISVSLVLCTIYAFFLQREWGKFSEQMKDKFSHEINES
jgi:hypothetical protein